MKPMKAQKMYAVVNVQFSRLCKVFFLRRDAAEFIASHPHVGPNLRIAKVLVTEVERRKP